MRLIGQVLIAIAILAMIETAAWSLIRLESRRSIDTKSDIETWIAQWSEAMVLDTIDPLLGWTVSPEIAEQRGLESDRGFIVLRTCTDGCDDTLRVIVTGGSTSDLVFDEHNWPRHLALHLRDEGVCATIFVGGVVGYNSGQETLKLLRDGLSFEPHVHISYAGANEHWRGYVSAHEQQLFEDFLRGGGGTLLPNAMTLIRRAVAPPLARVRLSERDRLEPLPFWTRNNLMMYGAAIAHGHEFIGVLQPVLGLGAQTLERLVVERMGSWEPGEWAGDEGIIERRAAFVLEAREFAAEHDFLHDLSGLFEEAEELVFSDTCHLDSEHQEDVSRAVLDALARRVDLSAFSRCALVSRNRTLDPPASGAVNASADQR